MDERGWRCARIAVLLLLTVATPVQLPAAVKKTRLPVSSQFQGFPLIRSRQTHLLVRALINDKPALLLVDTGAECSVIWKNRREKFGLTTAPPGMDCPRDTQLNAEISDIVVAHSVRLGGLNLVDLKVALAGGEDVQKSSQDSRITVDGILGADVLAATRAVIDCWNQVLILCLFPELWDHIPGIDVRGYQSMPLHLTDGKRLYVDGAVNGKAGRFMVDTGSVSTLLHRPFVRDLRIPLSKTVTQSVWINLRDDGVQSAQIRKFSIGMINLGDRKLDVTDLGGVLQDSGNSPPAVGVLGNEVLKRSHAIIDFGRLKLYLRRDDDRAKAPISGRK